jgi:glucosamine-6-phosphate deaminase
MPASIQRPVPSGGVRTIVCRDTEDLAERAAALFRNRVRARPTLAMAVPAGRTPRRMYHRMRELQHVDPVDFAAMRVFAIDELCPPAPADGYFWRQIRSEFLSWAGVSPTGRRPYAVHADDLRRMCGDYEAAIAAAGGLDLVMMGLGPNAHIASNEPGTRFDTLTRVVTLLPATVQYILTDDVIQGGVCDRAVTLGMATIMAAREVVVLVSGRGKRDALRRLVDGPQSVDVPATILHDHPCCTILADAAASSSA